MRQAHVGKLLRGSYVRGLAGVSRPKMDRDRAAQLFESFKESEIPEILC